MKAFVEILTAMLGTLGFAVVFRSKKEHLFAVAVGGALSWAAYLAAALFFESEPTCYFIASAVVGIYAEIFARILRTPTTNIFAVAVLPLIPGGALYYTMRYAVIGEWDSFLSSGSVTLGIAVAIALGIITVSTVVTLVTASKLYHKLSERARRLYRELPDSAGKDKK